MTQLSDYFGKNIEQKRVVITGGTTGIGKATADLLVSLGGRVFIFGRDSEDLNSAINDIKTKFTSGEIHGIPADVSKKEDIRKILEMVDKNLGGIDILINNAALPADGILESNFEEYKYVIETNILGYLAFTEEAVKRMKVQKSGHIINIGSMSAETRGKSSTIYVATKSAIRGFSTSLRKEVNALGIKVSLIEPGAVTSDMQSGTKEEHQKKIDKMEMLEAEDIAMSIVFCLSQPKRCDIITLQIRPHLQII